MNAARAVFVTAGRGAFCTASRGAVSILTGFIILTHPFNVLGDLSLMNNWIGLIFL